MAKSKTKEVEVEEIEEAEEVEELEDLDADVEEDEAPKSKKGKTSNGQPAVTFGVADLCKLIKEKTGKEYSTRDMRTLIRKLARDENPKVDREIKAGNRTRYDWPKGAKDPEVKAIIAAVEGGEIETARKATLDKLKSDKAAKKAKGEGGKKGKGKGKGKNKPAADDDAEDDDDE